MRRDQTILMHSQSRDDDNQSREHKRPVPNQNRARKEAVSSSVEPVFERLADTARRRSAFHRDSFGYRSRPLPYGRGSEQFGCGFVGRMGPGACASGSEGSLPHGRGSDSGRRAFSMAELMVAVVILGIGLLITTSMFPIAWLKARDVAESTNLSTAALTADTYAEMLLHVNGPRSVHPLDKSVSSFFPGDWFASVVSGQDYDASVYPDTRVHLLNTGNYGIAFATEETDRFDTSNTNPVPIGDNGWRLEDGLFAAFADPSAFPDLLNSRPDKPVIAPHVRMIPPVDARPDPNDVNTTPEQLALWNEQFETRRHCWAVMYRMADRSRIPGPDLASFGACDANGPGSPACTALDLQTGPSLRRPRLVTMYYITLKRPGNARYARQQGNEPTVTNLDIAMPRALPPAEDVLLPTPWRFEATVTPATLPADGMAPQTGIPTEITVNDPVVIDIVREGSFLIDDRNGEVFIVSAIKAAGSLGQAIFVLNKEYRAGDLYDVPVYDPASDHKTNYLNAAIYEYTKGTLNYETMNDRRFYWVFPPPVDNSDTVRSGGVPLFDGPQPVVGIEVRQLSIAPSLGP